ncbi:unnamed protein product [Amoebophrya sp. A120]|nr:unnamed protein product [Amoebophrya sp. A120]|eukprot:GSA120T00014601001.1
MMGMKKALFYFPVSWKLAGSTAAALLLLSGNIVLTSVVHTCQALEVQASSSSDSRGRSRCCGGRRGPGSAQRRASGGRTSGAELQRVAKLEDYFAPILLDDVPGGSTAGDDDLLRQEHVDERMEQKTTPMSLYSEDFKNLLSQRPLVSTVLSSRGREPDVDAVARSPATNVLQQPFVAERLGGGREPLASLLTGEEKVSLANAGRGWDRTAWGPASIQDGADDQVAQLQRSRVITVFARNFLRSLLAYQPRHEARREVTGSASSQAPPHLLSPREALLTVPPIGGRRESDAAETTRQGFPPIADVERTMSLLLALGELKKPAVGWSWLPVVSDDSPDEASPVRHMRLRLESRQEAIYYRIENSFDWRRNLPTELQLREHSEHEDAPPDPHCVVERRRRPKLTAVFEFALNTDINHGRNYAELRKVAVTLRHTPLEPVNRWPWYQTQSWASRMVIVSPEIVRKAHQLGGRDGVNEICGVSYLRYATAQRLSSSLQPTPIAELNIHTPSTSTRPTSEVKNYDVYDCSYEEFGGVADEEETRSAPVERGNEVWSFEGWEKVTRARQADRGLGERLRRRFARCCGTKRRNKQKDS